MSTMGFNLGMIGFGDFLHTQAGGMNLTYLDILVLSVPLIVVVAVSLYMRRYMHSVADFLAANRCAGRYLICTASGATVGGVMIMITGLEVFSRVGFSLRFWESFSWILPFIFGILGIVTYRLRETRALTFHQFFELRYSKGVRIFASFLNVLSGLFYFGLQPAVGARFFIYFCGLPEQCTIIGLTMPTFIPMILFLMAISLSFALTGGQISVMVTDCLEGVISSIFFLVVAFSIVFTVSVSQMRGALLSGSAGNSYVNPFDIGGQPDFNGWYVIIGVVLTLFYYRGNSSYMGFIASAKTAHEGRMAGILGNWRGVGSTAMTILVSIAAFTLLHHPDYSSQQKLVEQGLQNIGSDQLVTQMRMPMALGILLAPGVKGAFCAVLLFGLLAAQGAQLHAFGTTFFQDVILPLRKKPFASKNHLTALKITIFGVAAFVSVFSILYKPVDYLIMISTLISAIYLCGVGFVVWGGLYWKKGTTAGAWTALVTGAVLGVGFNLIQQFWPSFDTTLIGLFGQGAISNYLTLHAAKMPLNGLELSLVVAVCANIGYVTVSLLTCREDFNMDEMLHRGKYRIPGSEVAAMQCGKKSLFLNHLFNIDENFTLGDKILTIGTFCWTMFWMALALVVVMWTLFIGQLSSEWWFDYAMITGVWIPLVLAVFTTVWFFFGVAHDLRDLLRVLKTAKRVDSDDGTVRNHHNVGEPDPTQEKPRSETAGRAS